MQLWINLKEKNDFTMIQKFLGNLEKKKKTDKNFYFLVKVISY